MSREIEIERTARIVKEADPNIPKRRVSDAAQPESNYMLVAVIASVVAFVAILGMIFG